VANFPCFNGEVCLRTAVLNVVTLLCFTYFDDVFLSEHCGFIGAARDDDGSSQSTVQSVHTLELLPTFKTFLLFDDETF